MTLWRSGEACVAVQRPLAMVALVCVLVALASAMLLSQSGSARSRWWRVPCIQQRLALSPKQVHELDAIFSRDLPARVDLYKKITSLDAELWRMIRSAADENTVMRLSDTVENLRLQRNIRRHLMLLAMHRVLTPSQRRDISSRSGAPAYRGC
jgi:Spy/CpxP family protein refolding chaperone